MDPRLSWMRSFVAVVEELSFRRAAARLHLSTSAVSRHVRLLEDMIGAPLLSRTSRSVRPTRRGRELYADIVQPVAAVERALGRVVAEPIRVAYTGAAADELIPTLARRWRGRAPLALIPASSADQIDGLANNELDVGVMWEGPRSEQFEVVVLHSEPMHAAVPADHPSARRDIAPLHELEDLSWIMAVDSSDHVFRTAFVRQCETLGFAPRIVNKATGNQAQLTLVAAGEGACLVPLRTVRRPHEGVAFVGLRGMTANHVAVTRAVSRPSERELVRLLVELANADREAPRPTGAPDPPILESR